MYPYNSYKDNSKYSTLDYAVFRSPSAVVQDGNLGYQNLFDAILDDMHLALEKVVVPSLEVVVSETGWPTYAGIGTMSRKGRLKGLESQ